MGRVPSMLQATTEPDTFIGRPDNMSSDGFSTSIRPFDFISKTPISLVEPNLFLTALRILNVACLSPSK